MKARSVPSVPANSPGKAAFSKQDAQKSLEEEKWEIEVANLRDPYRHPAVRISLASLVLSAIVGVASIALSVRSVYLQGLTVDLMSAKLILDMQVATGTTSPADTMGEISESVAAKKAKLSILQLAGAAVLAQSDSQPALALSLLQ